MESQENDRKEKYCELMSKFLHEWNLKRDIQINGDEYYAVVAFAKWLNENT